MRLSDLDYPLPPELIAQHPANKRDHARLLVADRKTGALEHHVFHELPGLLKANDLLVINNTRVVPARVFGTRRGFTGRVEILFVRALTDRDSLVLARPGKKLIPGTTLELGEAGVPVEVVEARPAGRRVVRFPPDFDVLGFLEHEGHVPLPPYIRREDTAADRARYQTVFAREAGAVAAPTAGLHFTPGLLGALEAANIHSQEVTLHVGPGTFVPVTAEDPRDHSLEEEAYTVSAQTAASINATRQRGGRIVAVGTTSVRTLETIAHKTGSLKSKHNDWRARPGSAFTHTFIYPPYDFHLVDALITNFHLPKSSLLLLVAAFAGEPLLREAYRVAIRAQYRFYSYGDAMLIL